MSKVMIQEVGLRDGLQSVEMILPTDAKLRWIESEIQAGVSAIQVGSFVSRKLLPQLADTAALVGPTKKHPGVQVSALAANLRGASDAIENKVDVVSFVLSASESHNTQNVGRSAQSSLEELMAIVEYRNANNPSIKISGGIATAFGCTIEGPISKSRVLDLAEAMLRLGVDRIGLADTVGYANPRQVSELVRDTMTIAGAVPVGLHFHDTRGLGLANVFAAYEAGAREFDASLGGLGGCPFAPGASGNIVTEDVVFLFESMGVSTGIDLDALIGVRNRLPSLLSSNLLTGNLYRAGLPRDFHRN